MSQISPSFAVCSLPRTGSTALFRALSFDPTARLAYEPDFGDSWQHLDDFRSRCLATFAKSRGIKHVWDPNGYPFGNPAHRSTLETLAFSDSWIRVNIALARLADKVVFLRRHNQLARTVSDLLGQQTDLWGHRPERPHSVAEVLEYRTQLKSRTLEPLAEEVIEWYLHNAGRWEEEIMAGVDQRRTLTVYYEDLFSPAADAQERVGRAAEIGEWLGILVPINDERVQTLFESRAKLNDTSCYAGIPNAAQIVAKYGEMWL